MKTVTMHLDESPFRRIQEGEKNIEIRLYDEKRQELAVGGVITFVLRDNLVESFEKNIVGLHRFATFEDLFEKFPEERGDGNMYQYYSPEDERKYGVVGIELG